MVDKSKITRGEVITILDNVIAQLMDLHAALKEANPPKTGPENTICPIHDVPWQPSPYGLAHPPREKGGKWCNKATLEKSLAKKGS